MKVILNQTVPKVGKQGSIVTVKDGFARNYLFPRGLAVVAERRQVAALEKRLARLAEKEAGGIADANALAEKLNGQSIKIEGKVGAAAGKLFGAITAQDIADAIKAQLGIALDKKQVALIEPIKRLGIQNVELDLHRAVDANISVNVFDPNAPVEEVKAAEVVEEEMIDDEEEEAGEPIEA